MRDYGRCGRVGIGTPQANTTVEPEMAILLGPGVAMYTTRLTCHSGDSRERIIRYFETLPERLRDFDMLPLDIFGFACTGSSYLVGAKREARLVGELEAARGHKIVTAAAAIVAALRALGARRIALVSPYPAWLMEASIAYWQEAGLDIVSTATVALKSSDTRAIYDLGSDDAVAAVGRLDSTAADAVLIAGTGLPTLRRLDEIETLTGRPTLSSNLCLAWAMLRELGQLTDGGLRWGWERRLTGGAR